MDAVVACPHCGGATPANEAVCRWCRTPVALAGGHEPSGSLGVSPRRYSDAYALVSLIIGWGRSLQVLGAVVAVVATLAGVFSGLALGGVFFFPVALGGLLLGLVLGVQLFAQGTLMCAQGQMLLTSLDTAVNTSPFLSDSDKQRMLAG